MYIVRYSTKKKKSWTDNEPTVDVIKYLAWPRGYSHPDFVEVTEPNLTGQTKDVHLWFNDKDVQKFTYREVAVATVGALISQFMTDEECQDPGMSDKLARAEIIDYEDEVRRITRKEFPEYTFDHFEAS